MKRNAYFLFSLKGVQNDFDNLFIKIIHQLNCQTAIESKLCGTDEKIDSKADRQQQKV